MIRRVVALLLLVWVLGFAWFALILPQPSGAQRHDAVVVLTGGPGRIDRGLAVLKRGWTKRLFVAGVDPEVTANEFAVEYKVPARLMACCVTLEQASVDTRSNARELARWLSTGKVRSIRLVTSDWHMRRAAREVERAAPEGTVIVRDAVRSRPSLYVLVLEYNKLVARWIGDVIGL